MHKWTRTTGLLFLAAASVYIDQAARAEVTSGATPQKRAGEGVQLIEDLGDPFAQPTQIDAQPSKAGNSVTENDVTVSDAGTVEIHVNDANLVEVLRMLSLQSQRNIIASKQVRGTVTANLYDVTIREALDAILHANGYAYREKGNFIYVYTIQELRDIEQAERQMETRVFRLYYTPAANAVNMIKPVLSKSAEVAVTTPALSGIKEGGDSGGNSHSTEDIIVVKDYPENLEQVARVLKSVDERPQQVLVEATILRATLSDDNALGVDFTILGGVDFSTLTSSNGLITGAGIPTDSEPYAASGGTGNSFTQNINGGLRVGVVTSDVSVFVAALESITDTTVLANPKVLALNKQVGRVLVGREDGYRTATTTDTATIQNVEMLESGTKLLFRPYIANDGYIRMEIHPEDSTGTVDNQGLPSKTTTEVTTNVLVKDGHTIVIGGLFREASTASRNQIPVLGNLPLVGPLFRRQADTTRREEIIILITPHIVKNDSAYAAASEEVLRDADRLRVGVRRGMMPWGRERLAEGSYEAALKELASDNPNHRKALWFLDAATNLNPKFLEAVKLKESLTGREITSVNNSSIRNFVREQIMADPRLSPQQEAEVPAEPAVLEPQDVSGDADKVEAVTEVPTTQPVAEVSVSEEVAEVSTSEAVVEVTIPETVVELPTTQPVAQDSDGWLMEAVRPVDEDDSQTVAESEDGRSIVTVLEDVSAEAVENAPVELPVTITELPVDELEFNGDGNK